MVYKRGDYGISVETITGFGKNPGLWIRNRNQLVKVASFGSPEKAERFMKYLDYMLLINGKEPEDKET